jgi:hypothetical protein
MARFVSTVFRRRIICSPALVTITLEIGGVPAVVTWSVDAQVEALRLVLPLMLAVHNRLNLRVTQQMVDCLRTALELGGCWSLSLITHGCAPAQLS